MHGPPAAINRGPRNRPWTTMLRLSRNSPERLPRRRPSRRHRRRRPEKLLLAGKIAGRSLLLFISVHYFLGRRSPSNAAGCSSLLPRRLSSLAAGLRPPLAAGYHPKSLQPASPVRPFKTACSSFSVAAGRATPPSTVAPSLPVITRRKRCSELPPSFLCSATQRRRSPLNAAAHRPTPPLLLLHCQNPPRSTTAIPSIMLVAGLRKLPAVQRPPATIPSFFFIHHHGHRQLLAAVR